MPRVNLIKKREQGVAKVLRNRTVRGQYSLPTGWRKVKVANWNKLKQGDMILTVSRRHTLGGLTSRVIAKLIEGKYSHVSAYMRKENGMHMVRDFKGKYGHRRIDLNNLAKTGIDLQVVRWKGISEQQLADFMHNLRIIPKNIGTKYDFLQAGGYAYVLQLMKFLHVPNPEKYLPDIEKYFTCSEYLSTAGSPNKKEMQPPYNLKRPKPPLLFDPILSPEMVTPTTIEAAVKAGILEKITEQTWKKE